MKYIAYVMMFALIAPSFVSAQTDTNLNELMAQLSAQGDATTTSDSGSTTTATTTATTETTETHNAAEIKMQNITYTNVGSKYTITWTPIQGTANVEVSVKNTDTDMDYTKLQTVEASRGSVDINLTSQGTYTIKLTPVDALSTALGQDNIITIKVESPAAIPTTPQEAQESIKAAPQVGPAEDLLFGGLILVAILYFVYRFRTND